MRDYSETFTEILGMLAKADHYTIADFLAELFSASTRATGRSLRHGKMLGVDKHPLMVPEQRFWSSMKLETRRTH